MEPIERASLQLTHLTRHLNSKAVLARSAKNMSKKKSPMVWLHAEYETVDNGRTWTLIYRVATLAGEAYKTDKNYMPVPHDKHNGGLTAWHSRPVFHPASYGPDMFDSIMPKQRTLIDWRLTSDEQDKELAFE